MESYHCAACAEPFGLSSRYASNPPAISLVVRETRISSSRGVRRNSRPTKAIASDYVVIVQNNLS